MKNIWREWRTSVKRSNNVKVSNFSNQKSITAEAQWWYTGYDINK